MESEADVRVEVLVDALAARQPDKVGLIFGPRQWIYADLRDEVYRRAATLVEVGLMPGHVVATTEPVSDDAVITFLACCRADLTFMALSPQLTALEVASLVERANVKMLFTKRGDAHPAASTVASLRLAIPGIPGKDAMHEAARRSASGSAEAVASLVSTSGTTGVAPKIVMMPHRTMTFLRSTPERWSTCSDISYSPQSTQFMVRRVVEDISQGMRVVLSRAIDPQRIEAEMAECRATTLRTVPAVLRLLTELRHAPPANLALLSARTLSAPLPISVLRAAKERYGGIEIINAYGSSECGSLMEAREGAPEGSVGKPFPRVALRIVDEADRDVPEGEIGELIAQSPGLTLGYLNNPEATCELLRGGWMRSGDLARRDERGFYYIMGRRTLRVNVGGLKVSPEEVEAVLQQHPGVREVVVTAHPDPARGEVVRAVIVPRDTTPSVAELRHFCRERLAGYKVPRHWEFRDDLPRSPLGKVLRRRV